MTLQFTYQDEPLTGAPPPSLAPSATVRWRPLVPVSIFGPTVQVIELDVNASFVGSIT